MVMTTANQLSILVAVLFGIFGVTVLVPTLINLHDSSVSRRKNYLYNLNVVSGVEKISFDAIHNDPKFVEFSNTLKAIPKPPYVLVYDSSNVDTVLNHICNLEMIPNALARLVGVSLDEKAHKQLRTYHSWFPSVVIDLESIKKSIGSLENRNYLGYTLALVVHARICASLALRGIDFWSMHQDTIWVKNFEEMRIEDRYPGANMIFDRVGNDELAEFEHMERWIGGATFFVRASPVTHQFFRQVDSLMLTSQSPDSSAMSYLCGHSKYKCHYLPHYISSSFDYFQGSRDKIPVLIQLDAPKRAGETKMELMKRNGFDFRKGNGTCDGEVFRRIGESIRNAFPETRKHW